MAVRFFYVDESYDKKKFCLSAISIRYIDWHKSYTLVRDHRRELKNRFGLYIRHEIHARDLIAGRGKIATGIITKHDRARIFYGLLNIVAKLPRVWVFNICLDVSGYQDVQLEAWDRLLNRIERTMLEADKKWYKSLLTYRPRAMIFSDEGKETQITRAFRKMGVFNPVPSQYGQWPSGATKNIPITHIVEEPTFKKSHQSFLIQLADCVAFALLKKKRLCPSRHRNVASPPSLKNVYPRCALRQLREGTNLELSAGKKTSRPFERLKQDTLTAEAGASSNQCIHQR